MCLLSPDKPPPDEAMTNPAKEQLRRGTLYGSISVALLIVSFSLTMPHLQSRRDSLGCDALCYGSLMSTRSLLSLVGAALMGRLSDVSSNSRTYCLWTGSLASLVGMMIAANTYSIRGMWWSMIPGALFQQNFEIFKALFSGYHDAVGTSTPAERAASVGMLGMAAGLAFMAGPLAGATVLKTYEQANAMGMVAIVMSAALIYRLPKPTVPPKKKEVEKTSTGIVSFLDVQAARSPAGILFMLIRVCMGLAFHIFQTIWTTSLKQRFDFGPSDHGKFMSFIGLTYALSQGFVAKFLLQRLGGNTSPKHRVRMILGACFTLGVGRYVAFQTESLLVVYIIFGMIIMALGLVNTVLTADTSHLASSDEIGSLFGILAAVESASGMVGPILGGSLAYIHPVRAPMAAVVGLYATVFMLVAWGYEKFVLDPKGTTVLSGSDEKKVV
jgi:MFS family permease